MTRIGALLFILVLADVSNLRILAAEDKVSPSPSPHPEPGNLKLSPPPRKVNPSPALLPPPPPAAAASDDKGVVDLFEGSGCGAEVEKCAADELVACLTRFGDESKELFLLVHNGGEMALTVNIRSSLVEEKIPSKVTLAKHDSEKISVSTNATDVIEIVLNAGKKDCLLHVRPSISDWIYSQQFLAYASRLTPIHGAYFLFVSMLIAGGTWACCKFGRKLRRGGSGVPYQQLEMATQVETATSVADRNGVDGWDDSWDEGWDEEQAVVRPSENHPAINVSSNGLSSRAPNKDGWDNDWDD